jgi:hypothetical protein
MGFDFGVINVGLKLSEFGLESWRNGCLEMEGSVRNFCGGRLYEREFMQVAQISGRGFE